MLVESCAEGRAKGSEYRMPVLDAVRGMVVGYTRGGESAVGCVTRVDESGIWVVRGTRSSGRRNGREGIKVVFNGSCENREEIGKKWRALDLETEVEECRVRTWVDDVRDTDLEVRVISSAEHCECKTLERNSCGRVAESKVPGDDDSHMREKLEGVGIGCGDFEQYHEEFNRLATDPDIELLGFSDGSLSGDYTNGGYGWLVAVKEHVGGKLKVLAGGGGAAIASHATNVLLNTTRMEALGLAAGMSYARNWAGKVKWYIDNKGVIENFWRMPNCVANDWNKMGDRDVFGYINRMQGVVAGVWNVKHQRGHVEGREKDQRLWTNEEKGNVEADHVCGRARKMALGDELMWLERVNEWRAKCEELEEKYVIVPERLVNEIKLPVRVHVVPKVEPWKLPTNVQWELCWDNQVVVGKVADWVRETIQNTISNDYLAKQTAGLFRPGVEVEQESEHVCQEGDIFMLDGEVLEVKRVDGDRVMYCEYGEDGEEEDWVEGETERQKILVN